jgi:hypothetical protein
LPTGVEKNGPPVEEHPFPLSLTDKLRKGPSRCGGNLLYVDNATPHLRKWQACIQEPLRCSQSDEILGGIVFPPPDFDARGQKSNLIPISDSPYFEPQQPLYVLSGIELFHSDTHEKHGTPVMP